METVSPATIVWTNEVAAGEKRDVWTAMKRGFRCRCPRCGEGKLFRAFLKVDDHCSVCGLDFTPHRADDLPAYLVIVSAAWGAHGPATETNIRRRCGCNSRFTCRSRWSHR
jgi:uncharacterized protein (DUF983 family)